MMGDPSTEYGLRRDIIDGGPKDDTINGEFVDTLELLQRDKDFSRGL